MNRFIVTRCSRTTIALIVPFVVIGLLLLAWNRSYRSRQAEADAIQYVISNGGSIAYSSSENLLLMLLGVKMPTYILIDQLNGKLIDFAQVLPLQDVDSVQLTNAHNIDGSLQPLSQLPKLRILILSGSDVTADGLQHFRGNTSIESVHLQNTTIDDEMMQIMASMPNLEYLVIDRAIFEPDSLKHFSEHQNLQSLIITRTPLGDEHVELLLSLPGLTVMRCGVDQFSPDALEKLKAKLDIATD